MDNSKSDEKRCRTAHRNEWTDGLKVIIDMVAHSIEPRPDETVIHVRTVRDAYKAMKDVTNNVTFLIIGNEEWVVELSKMLPTHDIRKLYTK